MNKKETLKLIKETYNEATKEELIDMLIKCNDILAKECNKAVNQKIIEVTGCNDCLLCVANDMASDYSCLLKEYPEERYIERSKWYLPVTPKWCPLKEKAVFIKYKNK